MRKRETACPLGFTLIELLLVLAIIAVLAAVQLPRLNALLAKNALRSEAKALQWAMLTARTKAVMERREVRLHFDEAATKYWFEEQCDPINAPDEYLRPSSGPLGRPVGFASELRLGKQPTGSFFRFLPDGRVVGGNVRLLDCQGRFAELEFAESTNRVLVTYGKVEEPAWGGTD